MTVCIIKYNAGNTRSVIHAIERLGLNPVLSDDPETIRKADKVIFPGQGEAGSAMDYLKSRGLDEVIRNLNQPFLGICLGLQLLCKHSEEKDTPCLGVFDVQVKKFPPQLKVPHMGWNEAENFKNSLFQGLGTSLYMYYVHSYYAELSSETIAESNYILPFSAALHKNNFYAIQAHPEKSGADGERILKNFLSL